MPPYIPQGSVFGPLLSSLYSRPLGKVTPSYADDTQLILSFLSQISVCLTDISSWMKVHQLTLSPDKFISRFILISGSCALPALLFSPFGRCV